MIRNPLKQILESLKKAAGQPANDWDEYVTLTQAKDIVTLNLGGLDFMTESEIFKDMQAAIDCWDAYGSQTIAQSDRLKNILGKYRYNVKPINRPTDGETK